jgi:hypothetical protein
VTGAQHRFAGRVDLRWCQSDVIKKCQTCGRQLYPAGLFIKSWTLGHQLQVADPRLHVPAPRL